MAELRMLEEVAAAARVRRDIIQLADAQDNDLDLADRLIQAEQQIEVLREENSALRAEVERYRGAEQANSGETSA